MAAGDYLTNRRERIAQECASVMPPPGHEDVVATLLQKPVRSVGHRSRFRRNRSQAIQPLATNGPHGPSVQQFRLPPGLEEAQAHVRRGGQVKAQPIQPPGVFECCMPIPKEHSAGIAAYQYCIAHLVASSGSALEHQASIVAHHADIARRVHAASTRWQIMMYGNQKPHSVHMNTEGGYGRPEYGCPDNSSEVGSAHEVFSSDTASTRTSS